MPSPQAFHLPDEEELTDITQAMRSSALLVEQVVNRQLHDDAYEAPEDRENGPAAIEAKVENVQDSDMVLDMLDKLLTGFKHGISLAPIKERLKSILSSQAEKAELVNSLVLIHEQDGMSKLLALRQHLRNYIIGSGFRGDMTVPEAMAFLQMIEPWIKDAQHKTSISAQKGRDLGDLIDSADFTQKMSQEELEAKFSNTSPMGREIIRKIGWQLVKLTKEKEQ